MIILKNGIMVDPKTNFMGRRDLAIQDDRIIKIEEEIQGKSEDTIVDCTGKYIGPGLVDVHVHFRDPGFTYKEDIHSGSLAAIRGGFTTIVLMANTKPAVDNKDTINYILEKSKATDIHIYTCGTITEGMEGKKLTDFEQLLSYGAIGFTDDGVPLLDENIVKEAMCQAAKVDTVISFHEENPEFIENNGINRGKASEFFHVGGSDRNAEISMIERDLKFALETGAKVNFQHLSTKEAIELIRNAKIVNEHHQIYAEATPHHIALTEDAIIKYGSLAKMNPPLRTEADRLAIIEGLLDDTIDVIATDHAPHAKEEKNKKLTEAPSGIIGLETAIAIANKVLVKENNMSIMQLFRKMSYNPAKMYQLDAGYLAVNAKADIVVFDPNFDWVYENSSSKSCNSPFLNTHLLGKIQMTICKGKILLNELK